MRHYAGIGSRKTPDEILKVMTRLGYWLWQDAYTLRSGGAAGADKAFEVGCDAAHGQKEIFTADNFDIPEWAFNTVEVYHPAPHKLSDYAWRLHARNAMILLGADGASRVNFIVCWTPNGAVTGGTGQALRIAEDYGIPVRNLAHIGILANARKYIEGWSKSSLENP